MSAQFSIDFEAARLARRSDPVTSHLAAHAHVASGVQDCNLTKIVKAISQRPGLTSAELAVMTHMERHEAARRTADAERKGLAEKGAARKCSISGRTVVTWMPVELERAA